MPRLPATAMTATTMVLNGREVLHFGGCNYLGLAQHPAVLAAVSEGLARFGLSTGASRETTGNTIVHDELERDASAFLGLAAAVVTLDGYTANLAAAKAVAADHDVALFDARAHESMREAIAASGMSAVPYDHRSVDSAAERIARHAGARIALFTDGVFAADGALAPLPDLLAALPADGTLVVDDCHGFGVLGPGGRGVVTHLGLNDDRVLVTATFAKAMGCHGGLVAGPASLIETVRARGSAYIGATPTPPAVAGAARTALRVLTDEPERLERLRRNSTDLRASLRGLGLQLAETPTPIFAFVLDPPSRMADLHRELLDEGILAPLIGYPGGPASSYFRLAVTSEHTAGDIDRLISALAARL